MIQAEDELATIGMVLGAGWAGARSMTATSGPGISLMSEFAGMHPYFAEIPSVISGTFSAWDQAQVSLHAPARVICLRPIIWATVIAPCGALSLYAQGMF